MTAEEARALMPKKEPTVQDIVEEINIEIANAARGGKLKLIPMIKRDKVDEVVKHFTDNGFNVICGSICVGGYTEVVVSWAE